MRAFPRGRWAFVVVALAVAFGAMAAADAAPPDANSSETPFLAESRAAMDQMMAGMDAKASGDVDGDFAAMMIPHHQGAIDMAQAELRYGRNELLRRIAQEIVIEQQQEIAAMRLAVRRPAPPSAAAPDQSSDLSAADARPHPMPMMNMQPPQ